MFKVIKVDEENVYIASSESGKTLKINKAKLNWEVKVYDYVEFYDAGGEIIITKIPTEEALLNLQKEQQNHNPPEVQKPTTVEHTESSSDSAKTVGVICGLFLGLIGLIIGLLMYSSQPRQKERFTSGWGIGFLISIIAGVFIGIAYYSIVMEMLSGLY